MAQVIHETEVCIIGGGIMGCSTAYYLSRMGKRVAVVEKGQPGGEASTANTGSMAVQNKEPGSVGLTLKSLSLWEGLADELGCDVGFEMRGGYRLAFSEQDLEKLQRDVAEQNRLGVPVEIVPQSTLRKELPSLSHRVLAAGYCPRDSKADPLAASAALYRGAQRLGTVFLPSTRVTGIDVLADSHFLVKTPAGDVRASIIVNAANVWAGQIAAMVGCSLPVTMEIQMAMITNGGPRIFPHVLTAVRGNLTLKQEFPSGRVIIGGGWNGTGDYVTGVKRVHFDNLVGNLRTATEAIPALGNRAVVRAWACYEGRSPDRLLMIGPLPSPKGFYVQCCAKGGFTLAPIVGLSMAEWLATGKATLPMDPYLVSRFLTAPAPGGHTAGPPFG